MVRFTLPGKIGQYSGGRALPTAGRVHRFGWSAKSWGMAKSRVLKTSPRNDRAWAGIEAMRRRIEEGERETGSSLAEQLDGARERYARGLQARSIMRRRGTISPENYSELSYNSSMWEVSNQECTLPRWVRLLLERGTIRYMQEHGEALDEYETGGRHLADLHEGLQACGAVKSAGGEELQLAVIYGWWSGLDRERRYLDHVSIAYGPNGYERLIIGESWAVAYLRARGAEHGPVRPVEYDPRVPIEVITALWDPEPKGFMHQPERVLRAARKLTRKPGERMSPLDSQSP